MDGRCYVDGRGNYGDCEIVVDVRVLEVFGVIVENEVDVSELLKSL